MLAPKTWRSSVDGRQVCRDCGADWIGAKGDFAAVIALVLEY